MDTSGRLSWNSLHDLLLKRRCADSNSIHRIYIVNILRKGRYHKGGGVRVREVGVDMTGQHMSLPSHRSRGERTERLAKERIRRSPSGRNARSKKRGGGGGAVNSWSTSLAPRRPGV